MFIDIEITEGTTVPGIAFEKARILFEPCEEIHPEDGIGVFPTTNGALLIHAGNEKLYNKYLNQIMTGISDTQRYRGLPMRRISGTDTHGNRYAVVAVGPSDDEEFQTLADDWAGYLSGHAYNVRVQDYNDTFGVWTYRESDTLNPFFGDPNSDTYNPRAIVAAYQKVKND